MDSNPTTDIVLSTSPFPPPGFVDRHEAARMFGVAAKTWGDWERRGRVTGGRLVPIPGSGTRVKLYAIDHLQCQLEEVRKGPVFPPVGFVDRHEAARTLGISNRTLSTWESLGRVNCGRAVPIPGKPGTAKIYPLEALQQMAAEIRAACKSNPFDLHKPSEPFPPVGYVTRDQTCTMLGIKVRTLVTWECEGRFKQGIWSALPGNKPGRCRLYPIEEVNRLREEHERSKVIPQPYPDPDRPNVIRVPLCSDKHQGMEAIIDAESLPLVQGKRLNWGPGKRDGEGWVVLVHTRSLREALHQAVMGVRGKEFRVGHKNGNPLDCRRENLVVRTASQQKAATPKVLTKAGKPCSSRYKGVSRPSPTQRWTVSIAVQGTVRQLGRFRSEIGAALAYDDAARELFAEHAQLNFPNPEEAARMRAIALEEENAPPPPFPPPGFIDRRGACRMFGIGPAAWTHWEQTGRVRCGQSVPRPSDTPGRCRIYPIGELNRLLEEFNNIGKPYPDPDWRGCWRVPIRSMIHRLEAIIDAEDLPLVEGKYWNWSCKSDGSRGRVTLATIGKSVQLARLIARVADGEQKVSHINRDPLDCRRANLIVRSMAEQVPANRKMGTVSGRKYTSDFKGVSWDASRHKWKAQITSGETHRHIGRFEDEIAAAEAYDDAARELFGEHAYLNFPDGIDTWLEAQVERAKAETQRPERAEAA